MLTMCIHVTCNGIYLCVCVKVHVCAYVSVCVGTRPHCLMASFFFLRERDSFTQINVHMVTDSFSGNS